ncbi:hypothetical protein GUITHDRAFT_154150, partial [Guillardia theta CCMP2712]
MGGILSRSGRKTSVDGSHYDAPGRAGQNHSRHHDVAQQQVKRQQGTSHNPQTHSNHHHHHNHQGANHASSPNRKDGSPQVSRVPSTESNHGGSTDKARKSKPPALQPEVSLSGLNLTSPIAATPAPKTPESPGVAAFTSNILASAASH